MRYTDRSLVTVAVLMSAACTGQVLNWEPDAEGPGSSGSATSASGSTPGAANGMTTTEVQALPTSGLRRLTRLEYANSLHDLLGSDLDISLALPADEVADEGFEFQSVGAARATTTSLGVQQYETQALDVAEQVFSDGPRREALVGCAPASVDDPCVGSFLSAFGRRVFRRPLSSDELSRYSALVLAGDDAFDVWRGLQAATTAFLSSPHFLYRAELGAVDDSEPDGTRLRLDDFEVATRLSYLLWNTTPDDPLLDAAESGALASPQGLVDTLDRLLASPRSEQPFVRFFSEWLGFRGVTELPKDAARFPGYSPSLAEAMQGELETYVQQEIVRGGKSVLGLFDTKSTYVNAELAAFYGLPALTGDAFQKVTLPADSKRGGLLTFAGLLTANSRSVSTSPTLRGRFIRERLLCQDIPPPPPNVDAALPPPPEDGAVETMRERLARHTTEAACAGCHSQMDPLGLALEHFDAIGDYRELDQGKAIDATGDIDGLTFDGAVELGQLLAQHPLAARCVGAQLSQHAWGQKAEADNAWIFDALAVDFGQASFGVHALVASVVTHDSFRYSKGLR